MGRGKCTEHLLAVVGAKGAIIMILAYINIVGRCVAVIDKINQ